jgi:lipid-binding SYLF domain-containing protein
MALPEQYANMSACFVLWMTYIKSLESRLAIPEKCTYSKNRIGRLASAAIASSRVAERHFTLARQWFFLFYPDGYSLCAFTSCPVLNLKSFNMQRRIFLLKTATSLVAGSLAMTGCTTTASLTRSADVPLERRRREIDAGIDPVLARLNATVPDARGLIAKASGILVFPSVIAAGFGVGGQYGEGALRVRNVTADYYNLASVSVGLQIGAQSKSIILLFMTQDALDRFRKSAGWSVGADASVAVLRVGANGSIDTSSVTGPVLAFVLTNAGLMANLTLEGTKITRLTS